MIVLHGGELIDPASDTESKADVLIEEDRVLAIDKPGSFKERSDVEFVDISGKWVVPGLIDIHVHLREPGFEWKETIATGSRAAAAGGFTSIACMPNTNPCIDTPEVVRFILEQAEQAESARVLPIGAVSIGRVGKEMAPLLELAEAGCVAFSDDGDPVWDALVMRRALEWSASYGFPISCHEEIKELTVSGSMNESELSLTLGLHGMPGAAEDIMVARDIELARITGGHAHFCHVSTARSVELIRRAKSDGIAVSAEVTPHHLFLLEDEVRSYNTDYKMSPPLRKEFDREALRQGIADGTFDAIASDHAPHEYDAKNVEFELAAFGIIGFPTTLPLTLELVRGGVISRKRAIELLTSGPAKSFRLNAGRLSVGEVADITVIDPAVKYTLADVDVVSKSKNTPFIGRDFQGAAHMVYVAGKRVFKRR